MRQRVKSFSRKYLEEVAFIHSGVLDGWSEKGLLADLENSLSHSFVLLNEADRVVAYCSFSVCDVGELAFVCTHPLHRKKGYAFTLLKEAIDIIKAQSLVLEVRKGNTSAQGLYEKLGFKKIGTRKNMYQNPTDDGVIMSQEKDMQKDNQA